MLVADDEAKIRDVVAAYLEREGFRVLTAATGAEALTAAARDTPDLVILDLMLPDGDGEAVCRTLRRASDVPVIMLTAKSAVDDRVQGLAAGADDYVVKPFSPKELVARVHAVLRRARADGLLAERLSYRDGDLCIDARSRSVLKRGRPVALTATEFRLLTTLARRPGRVFSRDELIRAVLGDDYQGSDRNVDAHIKNLRHKIEDDPRRPVYVQTVYGAGYRFAERADD
ncbi:MAG: response regulator transcription factor [Clostridia bacterium]|nr:response regulator transcription factor [Clostridia bacterium]